MFKTGNLTILFLLIQLFCLFQTYALCWLLRKRVKSRFGGIIAAAAFLSGNALLAAMVLRLFQIAVSHNTFKWAALWLTINWFAVMSAAITIAVYGIGKYALRGKTFSGSLRIVALGCFIGFLTLGLYNAYTPVVRHYRITINKPLVQPLRIGMISDLHLGNLFGARQLDRLSEIMNEQKVDVILIPGDIMDDNTLAYHAEHMRPHLQKLRAPLGVYATLGNHDLFGHQNDISQAIRQAGITLLNDQTVTLNQRINIVGRPDKLDKARLPTAQLLQRVDTALPTILLDHRPDDIEQHAKLPIDIQVSGHIHNGQIFPANLIVHAINRLAYGHEAIGNGHFFVTSGYGFWGVPIRLGSQSEVVIIDVHGKK